MTYEILVYDYDKYRLDESLAFFLSRGVVFGASASSEIGYDVSSYLKQWPEVRGFDIKSSFKNVSFEIEVFKGGGFVFEFFRAGQFGDGIYDDFLDILSEKFDLDQCLAVVFYLHKYYEGESLVELFCGEFDEYHYDILRHSLGKYDLIKFSEVLSHLFPVDILEMLRKEGSYYVHSL